MRAWTYRLVLLTALALYWVTSAVTADTVYCDDPDDCSMTKRFLRFGRAVTDDPLSYNARVRRQFMRFGRDTADDNQPYNYQDKRFLRFGRSSAEDEAEFNAYIQALLQEQEQAEEPEPLYRKRRSLDENADSSEIQSEHEMLRRSRRSAELPEQAQDSLVQQQEVQTKALEKRDADMSGMEGGQGGSESGEPSRENRLYVRVRKGAMPYAAKTYDGLDDLADKRFMRFGKRFMRFGRAPAKRFMRFGKKFDDFADKRFMRFGKRNVDDSLSDKRFMRFGRNLPAGGDKRFMRFGKRLTDFADKRFMRFGKRFDDLADKRFLRFGKRSLQFASDPYKGGPMMDADFAKRFLRFGRSARPRKTTYMIFGKRGRRSADQQLMKEVAGTAV